MLPQNIKNRLHAGWSSKIVVLVTGVFDLLHDEHKLFLKKAKKLGDVLIVAIESDVRVRLLKGADRPIWNQQKRAQMVLELEDVDASFILPEQFSKPTDHEALIREVRPSILAVSSHTPFLEKKRAILTKYGGEVVVAHRHNPKLSTTQLLNGVLKSEVI